MLLVYKMEIQVLHVLLFFSSFVFIVSGNPSSGAAKSACPSSIVDIEVGNGRFSSPSYPVMYPANSTCRWRLTAPSGSRINISSVIIQIEETPGCLFDHLVIYDGGFPDAQVLGRFCGTSQFTVETSANEALVVFSADASYGGLGFELAFSKLTGPKEIAPRIDKGPNCNRTISTGPGYLISPNFPLPANANTFCTYRFTAPEGKVVELMFTFFHVEPSSYCQYDSVEVFDGPTKESENIGVFCGSSRPPVTRSTGRHLFLVYQTDATYTQHGFNVSYSFLDPSTAPLSERQGDKDCSRTLEMEGTVTSPGYPSLYLHNKMCVYVIRAPLGKFVKVVFDEFKLEESENCVYDSLVIYDGATDDFPLGSFCGQQMASNTSITSAGNTVTVRFISDMTVSDFGFVISFSFVSETDSIKCYLECENGGKCTQQRKGPMCDCPPPYSGPRCERKPADCSEEPCLNGGTCSQLPDLFFCSCLPEFAGLYCDERGEEERLQFLHAPQNRTGLLTDTTVTLQCQVNREEADIRWFFNEDTPLVASEITTRKLNIDVHDGGVLVIPHLTEDNAGKYTCVADDGIENIRHDAWVTTDAPCFLEFVATPQSSSERVGKNSHLFACKAIGGKAYHWEKDDVPVQDSKRFQTLVNNYLQVSFLEPTDSGKYTCVVRGANCVQRKSAWLDVIGSAVINTCGRPKFALPGGVQVGPRITSGRRALEGSYPWFALLYDTVTPTSFCGGSIIDERWIITAAHCIRSLSQYTNKPMFGKDTTKIYVGTNHCRGSGGVELSVDEVVVHPGYDHATETFNNDIALIKVNEKIRFTSQIMPICLQPLSFLETRFIRVQGSGYVAGCGLTAETGLKPLYLLEVKLPIREKSLCHKNAKNNSLANNMICAGYRMANRGDSCNGDSGGGFVVKSGNQFSLAGIVSWGIGCDRAHTYGYYTNVGKYFKWIHQIID